MFSPVSQNSKPSSIFFSLSPPFISSFTPFHHFEVFNPTVLFQLNLGLSMDSTTFVLSHFPHFLHHLILNFSSFLFPQSTLLKTLSPPFHLMCLMVYPLSHLSSFSLISLVPFPFLSTLSFSISLFQQTCFN